MSDTRSETPTVRAPMVVTLTAVLTTATIGLLLFNALGSAGALIAISRDPIAVRYAGAGSLVIVLLAVLGWHLAPRAAWPVLIALGAVLSIPRYLGILDPEMVGELPALPLAMTLSVAPALVLTGLLGGGSWLAQVGRPDLAGAVIGTAVVAHGSATLVYDAFDDNPSLALWLAVALGTIGMIGAIVLVVVAPMTQAGGQAPRRPSWRVTLAGLVGAALTAVPLFVHLEDFVSVTGSDALAINRISGFYLVLGLILLAATVAASLIAGPRVLAVAATVAVAAAAVALPVPVLGVEPGAIATGALTGLAGGFLLALAESRARLAVTALVLAGVGGLAVWLTARDAPLVVVSAALIAVGLAGAIPAIAAVATPIALRSNAPAVIAGCAVALQGALQMVTFALRTTPFDGPGGRPLDPAIGLASVGLLLVAGAVVSLVRSDRRRPVVADLPDDPAAGHPSPTPRSTVPAEPADPR